MRRVWMKGARSLSGAGFTHFNYKNNKQVSHKCVNNKINEISFKISNVKEAHRSIARRMEALVGVHYGGVVCLSAPPGDSTLVGVGLGGLNDQGGYDPLALELSGVGVPSHWQTVLANTVIPPYF
eukprot:GHVR01139889.1.p1 GENE.GHVR01139889.1~~GHVR01139889.1.p1  ORF type:complete len:125 (-),score=41.65 GHVR01139889.1:209-583(-)